MKKTCLFLLGFFFIIIVSQAQTITDIDGNTYNTITIGPQTWMKENLKTTHFSNGNIIPTTTLSVGNDSTVIYQWAYNNDSVYVNTYGLLYSFYAVADINNVCPAGWHVPSDSEWTNLSNFLGGDSVAGDKMKEAGTLHWSSTDTSVNNSSGFTGLPGGFRGNSNVFLNKDSLGGFWSSTLWGSSSFPRAYNYNLKSKSSTFEQTVGLASCGFSVRCLKDLTAGTENMIPENRIKIFPNPASDRMNISIDGIKDLNVFIYNLEGTLVFQKHLSNRQNSIDLTSLSEGIYIVKLVGAEGVFERKLIKE